MLKIVEPIDDGLEAYRDCQLCGRSIYWRNILTCQFLGSHTEICLACWTELENYEVREEREVDYEPLPF